MKAPADAEAPKDKIKVIQNTHLANELSRLGCLFGKGGGDCSN